MESGVNGDLKNPSQKKRDSHAKTPREPTTRSLRLCVIVFPMDSQERSCFFKEWLPFWSRPDHRAIILKCRILPIAIQFPGTNIMKRKTLLLVIPVILMLDWHMSDAQWKIPSGAPLLTRWAKEVSPSNPLPEYPRPQLVREDWLNLNGLWEFA
jgi:hypothetical protein